MRRPLPLRSIALTAPLFAIAGGVSRFTLQTTQSRWQIAALAGAAACLEAGLRCTPGQRASALRFLANAAAAAVVVAAVKYHLEPGARRADAAAVRQVSKAAVRSVDRKL